MSPCQDCALIHRPIIRFRSTLHWVGVAKWSDWTLIYADGKGASTDHFRSRKTTITHPSNSVDLAVSLAHLRKVGNRGIWNGRSFEPEANWRFADNSLAFNFHPLIENQSAGRMPKALSPSSQIDVRWRRAGSGSSLNKSDIRQKDHGMWLQILQAAPSYSPLGWKQEGYPVNITISHSCHRMNPPRGISRPPGGGYGQPWQQSFGQAVTTAATIAAKDWKTPQSCRSPIHTFSATRGQPYRSIIEDLKTAVESVLPKSGESSELRAGSGDGGGVG